jgi:hypothetical protein
MSLSLEPCESLQGVNIRGRVLLAGSCIAIDISGSSALSSSHAGCPAPPTLANPQMVAYKLAMCATAQFLSSASAEFAIGPDVDGAVSRGLVSKA